MYKRQSTSLPNIILIGLMGCGKTTIGKELHRETHLGFTDTDQLIERQTGNMCIRDSLKVIRSSLAAGLLLILPAS